MNKMSLFNISGVKIGDIKFKEDFNINDLLNSDQYLLSDIDLKRAIRDLNTLTDSKYKALIIIDDDEDILETLLIQAKEMGHYAEGYTSPDVGFERIKDRNIFDLVILDYSMPEIDGKRVAKIISSMNDLLTVVLFTGYEFFNVKEMDNIPVVYKPSSLDQIIKMAKVYEYHQCFKDKKAA